MKMPAIKITWQGVTQFIAFCVGIAVMVILLLIVVSLTLGDTLNPPDFSITALDTESQTPLCPGATLDVHNYVVVSHPTILFFYVSVMDEKLTHNINGTQTSFPGRPHPSSTSFRQTLPWTVPRIPPGVYQRVVAVRDPDSARRSVFSTVRFRVGDCPTKERARRIP